MTAKKLPPEPGTIVDLDLGIPGKAEPQPYRQPYEPTEINEEEDEE